MKVGLIELIKHILKGSEELSQVYTVSSPRELLLYYQNEDKDSRAWGYGNKYSEKRSKYMR